MCACRLEVTRSAACLALSCNEVGYFSHLPCFPLMVKHIKWSERKKLRRLALHFLIKRLISTSSFSTLPHSSLRRQVSGCVVLTTVKRCASCPVFHQNWIWHLFTTSRAALIGRFSGLCQVDQLPYFYSVYVLCMLWYSRTQVPVGNAVSVDFSSIRVVGLQGPVVVGPQRPPTTVVWT